MGYTRAFVDACKEELDPKAFQRLHARARNSTGGKRSAQSRQAARDDGKAELLARRRETALALSAIELELEKAGPTRAQAHIPRPAAKLKPAAKPKKVPSARAKGLAALAHEIRLGVRKAALTAVVKRAKQDPALALALLAMDCEVTKDFDEGSHPRDDDGKFGSGEGKGSKLTSKDHHAAGNRHKEAGDKARERGGKGGLRTASIHYDLARDHFKQAAALRNVGKATKPVFKAEAGVGMADSPDRDAQRLVSGMDFEMQGGATTVPEAWTRASSAMRRQWTRYDNSFTQDQELARLDGLDLDLGCGQARARGYLGLDLYPYDYGTVIRDLGMGIGFGPNTARSIRLVNALDSLDDYREDPLPLLADIQSHLQEGGRLYYEGSCDLTELADFTRLPGLALVDHADSARYVPMDGTDIRPKVNRQTFERIPIRRSMVHGADPGVLGVDEAHADEIGLALTAIGATVPETAMANLLHKSVRHTITKSTLALQPAKQIVTSVVYSPDELDTDGEFMDASDIERAAHDYMRDARKIGSEHGSDAIGAHVVESWITPHDMTLKGNNGDQEVKAGSWLMSVRIEDKAEWKKVLDGTYTGFSLGGYASLHEDS